MSMMRCQCDRIVDTDYDVEGLFEDASPFRFWCSRCVEDAVKNDDKELLAALQKQEPETYKEMTDG